MIDSIDAWRREQPDLPSRSEAIRRYRHCVATLETELGVAPLPRTTQLYRAILEDRVPVMAAAAPEPTPALAAAPGRDP
jgi:DNA-binding SARP family transcriptional activator